MFVCCSCRGVGRVARAFILVNLAVPSGLQAKSSDILGIVFSHMTSLYEYKENNRNSPMHDTMISSMPVCTYVRTKCTGQVSRLAAHGCSSHGSGPPGSRLISSRDAGKLGRGLRGSPARSRRRRRWLGSFRLGKFSILTAWKARQDKGKQAPHHASSRKIITFGAPG